MPRSMDGWLRCQNYWRTKNAWARRGAVSWRTRSDRSIDQGGGFQFTFVTHNLARSQELVMKVDKWPRNARASKHAPLIPSFVPTWHLQPQATPFCGCSAVPTERRRRPVETAPVLGVDRSFGLILYCTYYCTTCNLKDANVLTLQHIVNTQHSPSCCKNAKSYMYALKARKGTYIYRRPHQFKSIEMRMRVHIHVSPAPTPEH